MKLLNHLHAFHITCSYDEILRFKKSAAVATKEDINMEAIKHADNGMIQVIVDNFDVDISSQNGKLSTHSLAVLVTQPDTKQCKTESATIRRIKKEEMSKEIDHHVQIQRYAGAKKPIYEQKCSAKGHLTIAYFGQAGEPHIML